MLLQWEKDYLFALIVSTSVFHCFVPFSNTLLVLWGFHILLIILTPFLIFSQFHLASFPYQPNFVFFTAPLSFSLSTYKIKFVLSIYYWVCGLKKNWLSLSQQLLVANSSSVRAGISCPTPLSTLKFFWVELTQVLGMLSQLQCVHMCSFSVVDRK